MADSTVTIKIQVDADTAAIDRVQARLAALSSQAATTNRRFNDLGKTLDNNVKSLDKTNNALTDADDKLKKATKSSDKLKSSLTKLGGILKALTKFLVLGFLVNLAAVGVALVSVNAAFAVGAAAVKAYRWSMSALFQVMAGAGAAAVNVLSALAAGQREYLAALNASRYGGGAQGVANASAQMRGLTANTRLAVLGAEALQGAFVAVSRQTRVTGQITSALTALGDFAASSADPAKSFTAAGEFIGQLVKEGKLTQQIVAAAGEIGPEFEKAVKDAQKRGLTSSDAFLSALIGGELSKDVAGQLDTINNTLFGTAKRNFQLIKEQFADLGQPLLGPFTEGMERIAQILRRSVTQISAATTAFGKGSFFQAMTEGVDKLAIWSVKTFNEYLPKAEGMFKRISVFFREFRQGWDSALEKIRPLTEGGSVLIDTFGPALSTIFSGFGRGLYEFSDLLKENRDDFMEFGETLKNLAEDIGRLFGVLKKALVDALPTINRIFNLLSEVFAMLVSAFGGLASMGQFGAVMALGGFGYGYKKLGDMGQAKTGKRGRGVGRVAAAAGIGGTGAAASGLSQASSPGLPGMTTAMHVQARIVYLYGKVIPGRGAGPMGRSGALPPPTGQAVPLQPGGLPLDPTAPAPGAGPAAQRFARLRALGGRFAPMAPLGGYMAMAGLPMLASMYGGFGSENIQNASNMASMVGMGSLMMGKSLPFSMATAGIAMGSSIGADALSSWALGMGEGTSGKTFGAIGIGSGIAAGAGIGAALGNIIPIPGIGAGIGAVIGGIAGGITGYLKQGQIKKESKEAAKTLAGQYDEGINAAFEARDMASVDKFLTQMRERGKIEAKNAGHQESFNKEFEKHASEIENKMLPALKMHNDNVDMLAKTTGIASGNIEAMAKAAGVDLVGSLTDVRSTIEAITGINMWKTTADMEMFISTTFGDAMYEALMGPIDAARAQEAWDQSSKVLRDKLTEGIMPSQAEMSEFLLTGYEYFQRTGSSPEEAISRLAQLTGPGGAFYQKGFALQGGEKLAPDLQKLIISALEKISPDLVQESLVNVNQRLEEIYGPLAEMDLAATTGTINTKLNAMVNRGDVDGFVEFFAAFARLGDPEQVFQVDELRRLGATVTTFNTAASNLSSLFPNINGDPPGDTSSSRLSSTLGKHSYFDSQLAGKRSITSAQRNFNLGSLNSDHATGNAYDLVGQNLGAYQQMVNRSGGFAEFHGGSANRHLHVVPGGMGDTTAPVPSLSLVSTPSAGTVQNMYQITINPSDNATPEEIAQAVMDRIARENRSAMERR